MKRSRGLLSGGTRKLRKKKRTTISEIVKEFKIGDKVVIETKVGPGMPHPRYKGRYGVIVGARGKAYVVEVTDGSSKKKLIASPVQLMPA